MTPNIRNLIYHYNIPNPPAFVTAAARPGPAATFIPAKKIGCLILNSFVRGVTIVAISIYFFFIFVEGKSR